MSFGLQLGLKLGAQGGSAGPDNLLFYDPATESSITITSPSYAAGTYTDGVDFDEADLATGPVNLFAPDFTGVEASGNTLTRQPGFWIGEAADGEMSVAIQWFEGNNSIAGATGETYTVQPGDGSITVRETVTNAAGSAFAGGPVASIALVASDTTNTGASSTETSLTLSSYTPASDSNFLVVVLVNREETADIDPSAVTWRGSSITGSLMSSHSYSNGGVDTKILLYGIINPGTSAGDLAVSYSAGMRSASISIAEFSGIDTSSLANAWLGSVGTDQSTLVQTTNLSANITTTVANEMLFGVIAQEDNFPPSTQTDPTASGATIILEGNAPSNGGFSATSYALAYELIPTATTTSFEAERDDRAVLIVTSLKPA